MWREQAITEWSRWSDLGEWPLIMLVNLVNSWLCLLTVTTRVISSGDLYCCLLSRCEALRTCRSGFPIATVLKFPWSYSIQASFDPFSPAKTPNLTEICNLMSRKAIELESYPNHPRIQQVLWSKSKKNDFCFRWRDFWRWRHKEDMFWKFWPLLACPRPQPIAPLFWLKVLLKTRSKCVSAEPWIDLLAYL